MKNPPYTVSGPLFDTYEFQEIMGVDMDDYLSYTSSCCDLADFSSDDESRWGFIYTFSGLFFS